ncbi:S-adenosyl-L-methionine-dependent methyltransferase [Daedaleopsis nitida]|nr:S-adenosyl-L-methionine-dependent methyltransferase [Daedaleopsis nitida]
MANHAHEHGHNHHDGHGGHPHDFAAANRAHFDEHAHKHTGVSHAHADQLAIRAIDAFRKAWPDLFDDERTTVLDYACGTGAVSRQLCQHVKSIVGVDISPGSVDIYNTQVSNQGLEPDEMKAVCLQLKGEPGELGDAKFDVIVCCASYHHFASIEDTTRVLASFLKPGGSLIVSDIRAAEDHHELFAPTHHHIVPHKHGLCEDAVRGAFESAGLVNFEMQDAFKAKLKGTKEEVQWFVVRGVKAAGAS